MANEYIDREKIAAEARKLSTHLLNEWDTLGVLALIDRQPAADVAEVRHGRWIADKEDVEWGNYLIRYRCSECKERPHFDKDKNKFILSPYCPNCGAKMEDEK